MEKSSSEAGIKPLQPTIQIIGPEIKLGRAIAESLFVLVLYISVIYFVVKIVKLAWLGSW